MPKIQVWAEICEERLRAFEEEAQRRGVTVESLVETTVNELLRELEHDQSHGADCPCIVS